MKFRPCIDIHNGKVKQIVGSSIDGDNAVENFISDKNADYFARMYKADNLIGGHIVLLNSSDSEYKQLNINNAKKALSAYPNGMQIGGGVNDQNVLDWLNFGASHVIVTSYVFHDGIMDMRCLERLRDIAGKNRIVLDLSCKRYDNDYFIMTNRWQYKTDQRITYNLLDMLADFCDEYLIHAVDVEGKNSGIDNDLCKLLGKWNGLPITYAGGISDFNDIELIREFGNGNLDFTIGSSLDIFGGHMPYNEVVKFK